jgi:hypothetical protein
MTTKMQTRVIAARALMMRRMKMSANKATMSKGKILSFATIHYSHLKNNYSNSSLLRVQHLFLCLPS